VRQVDGRLGEQRGSRYGEQPAPSELHPFILVDWSTRIPFLAQSLNAPDVSSLDSWTEAELYQYAEEALHDIGGKFQLIVDYDETIALVADQALYGLPALHIATIYAAADGAMLNPSSVSEMEALDDQYEEAASAAAPTHWVGNNLGLGFIRIYPPKNGAGVLVLVFQKHPPDLTPTAPSGGGVASVTYSYPLTGNPTDAHTLTLAGVTYSILESTYTVPQIAAALAALAADDPLCAVTDNPAVGTITIRPRAAGGAPIAVSGSDGNAAASLVIGGAGLNLPEPVGDYLALKSLEQARRRQGDGQLLDAAQAFATLGQLHEKVMAAYYGAGM